MSAFKDDLFRGQLVRLVAPDPAQISEHISRWGRNSDYTRLMDSDPARMYSGKAVKEWLEGELKDAAGINYMFIIHTVADDRPIGFIELDGVQWQHGEAWVGIGIGDPGDWGRGYGTQAMQLALRFAFEELNLYRVSLNVFAYNQRAARSYQKVGFVEEGRLRQALRRDGKRWDMIFMGILRNEFEGDDHGDTDA